MTNTIKEPRIWRFLETTINEIRCNQALTLHLHVCTRERVKKERTLSFCMWNVRAFMLKNCQWRQKTQSQQSETKQVNAIQKRGAYDITGIEKSELRADDDVWQLQEATDEHMIRPDESSVKAEMRSNTIQLRKLMYKQKTLSDKETKDIASSEEENEKLYERLNEIEKVIKNEPALKKSPNQISNKNWESFDSFDKEYETQWKGHNPNIEVLHELLNTSQIATPNNDFKADAHIAQVLKLIQKKWPMTQKTESAKTHDLINIKKTCIIWLQTVMRIQSPACRSLFWKCLNNMKNIKNPS